MTKVTIALVAHDVHDGGGMERAFAELVIGSPQYDWIVVAASVSDRIRAAAAWHPVRVPRRPFPMKFAAFWSMAPPVLRSIQPDLVHTMGAIIPGKIDVASVQFCHAAFNPEARRLRLQPPTLPRRLNYALHRRLAYAAERRVFQPDRVRMLLPVSDGVLAELGTYYTRIPAFVTPNGVDSQRFRPDHVARAAVRSEVGDEQAFVALFVGGDWHRKGLAVAIDALAHARRVGQDVVLWVVGSGDEVRYGEQARSVGVRQSVRFLGPKMDTERYFQAADTWIFPTAYEAFPLVGLEAAASGLPLIATRVNGMPELIGDQEGGLWADRNGASMGQALTRLCADPELCRQLGQNARSRGQHYSWDLSRQSVHAAYESLLS